MSKVAVVGGKMFAQRVSELRKRVGLTVDQVCAAVSEDEKYWWGTRKLMAGNYESPAWSQMVKLSTALRCTLDELIVYVEVD